MNINELFNIQKELDIRISTEHQLEGHNLVSHKILALEVELGELANETRCFKYWSKKKPSEREVILEEYVDCLHFVLSIGLEKDYLNVTLTDLKEEKTTAVDQFLVVFNNISNFQVNQTLENYLFLWQNFMLLGVVLGFEWEEVTTAYLKKNEINHKRQAEGY